MHIHMKFFGHEYKGCAVHCLPDIVHKPLLEGQICQAHFFVINSENPLGGLIALILKLQNFNVKS